MTIAEFASQREARPCRDCGTTSVVTQLNPNNNGLQAVCENCASKRPWGSVLFLKQNEHKRSRRPPLPNGETLDSIWAQYGDRCVVCSAPKSFLIRVGIGRQVHHVGPYKEEGHRGRVVPICTHCHTTASDRQKQHWFYRRIVLGNDGDDDGGDTEPQDHTSLNRSRHS